MFQNSTKTLQVNGATADFYNHLSQYLSPLPHIFLTLIMLFMHSNFITLLTPVYEAYKDSFKLVDFMNIVFEPKSAAYTD